MKERKNTIIIQVRTQSIRLPNKVLVLINDKPLIQHIIQRFKKTKSSESYSSDSVKKMSKSDLKKYLSDLDLSMFDFT